jgi:hypothetical protein
MGSTKRRYKSAYKRPYFERHPRQKRALKATGRLCWIGVRGSAKWTGRHTGRLALRGGKAVVVASGGSAARYRQWRDEQAEYGLGTPMVTCHCGCGERWPAWQMLERLAAHDGDFVTRPELPTGHKKLLNGRPRRDVFDAEGRVVGDDAPQRKPRAGEVACPHCRSWVGSMWAWHHDHAPACQRAAELRQELMDKNLRWRAQHAARSLTDEERERLVELHRLDEIAAIKREAASPVTVGATVTPIKKGINMQDPKVWGRASAVLREPQIDQRHWTVELPLFLKAVADSNGMVVENVDQLCQYLTRANVPGNIIAEVRSAQEFFDMARTSMLKATQRTEEWIANRNQPDFARAN